LSVVFSVLTLARLCSIRSHLTTEAVLSSRQEDTTNANYGKSLDQYPVDTGRLRRVVEVAAERSGWAHKKPEQGRALGFAAQTHVHLLPSHDLPAGVGEPGVPPTIPALCNALFVATGKRMRQLPIKHTKLT
jgi:CO/xanthine dehydrogenase Mo-binding subunit